jgi:predicted  nucleic acid-binding Zn-ribbon protein
MELTRIKLESNKLKGDQLVQANVRIKQLQSDIRDAKRQLKPLEEKIVRLTFFDQGIDREHKDVITEIEE